MRISLGTAVAGAAMTISISAAAYPAPPYGGVPEAELRFSSADIGGVKLGMSLEEVRALLRHHKTLTKYSEETTQLTELNSKYISVVRVSTPTQPRKPGTHAPHDSDQILVFFSPIPGKETVLKVGRERNFSTDSLGAKDQVIDAMIEKFGQPWARDQSTPMITFGQPRDPSGVLKLVWRSAPANLFFPAGTPDTGACSSYIDFGVQGPSWGDFGCGAAQIMAVIDESEGPMAGPHLTSHYSVILVSPALKRLADDELKSLRDSAEKKRADAAKKTTKADL